MFCFDGYEEQDIPYRCPDCGHEFSITDAIGVGLYPAGGWRAMMKPQSMLAVGFECPECWTKSCCHADEKTIHLIEDFCENRKLQKSKGRL